MNRPAAVLLAIATISNASCDASDSASPDVPALEDANAPADAMGADAYDGDIDADAHDVEAPDQVELDVATADETGIDTSGSDTPAFDDVVAPPPAHGR